MHTVRLVGELNRSSAVILEAEIERACEVRVDAIALDLSELTRIDHTGVAVVVFRSGWCERRGCRLVLIAGRPAVRLAFAQARASERLDFVHAADELLAATPGAESLPAAAAGSLAVSPPQTERSEHLAARAAVAAEGAPVRSSSVRALTGQGRATRRTRRRHRRRG
jgi:anti-anti-sigma factor